MKKADREGLVMKRMKKAPARLGCAMLVILLILGMGTPALAAGGEPQSITFTNEYDELSGFSVVKTVSNYSKVPDGQKNTEFTFYAEFDGKPARNQEYIKFNGNGQRIYLLQRPGEAAQEYSESEAAGLSAQEIEQYLVPYKTGMNGKFSLKAGERAMFTDVPGGTDVYVEESPTEKFAQDSPAGGKYRGKVPGAGIEEAEFVNRYIEPPTGGEKGKLYIEKAVAQPGIYGTANDEKFTFTLSINGNPWSNKEYSAGGRTEETDEYGRFRISGGETAVFSDIPAGTEFAVSEEIAAYSGWWFVGATLEKNGGQMSYDEPEIEEATATKGNTKVVFTNANASFGVKKELTEGSESTDKEFRFVLQKADGSAWEWASYRVYDQSGKLTDDELHNTSTTGIFTLKAGQTAIFYGIEPGTAYKVTEQSDGEYRQVVPESEAGYEDEVREAFKLLHFTNEKAEKNGSLRVTKNVVSLTGGAVPDAIFSFRIYKVTEAGEEALSNTTYSVLTPDGSPTYSTDAEGTFTLKAGQTAEFPYVESGMNYKVVELGSNAAAEKFVPEDGDTREGTVTEEGLYLEFVNDYGDFAGFSFYKTAEKSDAAEATKYLAGAVFSMTPGTETDGVYTWSANEEDVKTAVSGADGLVSFTGLINGVYKLEEVAAPTGYKASPGYWIVAVDTESGSEIVEGVGSPKAFSVNAETEALELPNPEILYLPQSGSIGELMLICASAVSAMLCVGVCFARVRKKTRS